MACFPQLCTYTQDIGFTRAIPGTDENGRRRLGMRNEPATYQVVSLQRGKSYILSRKVKFKGAISIFIIKVAFLRGVHNCLYHIKRYSKHHTQRGNTTT